MDSQSLLFHANCPSCGAEIGIHSATALTAVCGYCHSVLMINNRQLIKSRRRSAILEDFSPLQIGTTGVWKGQQFILTGRIQVHYEAGMWNEWHALFTNGNSGWLSEAGDRFVFTQEKEKKSLLEKFPICGSTVVNYQNRNWVVTDIRQIKQGRLEGEGELPLELPRRQKVHTIDLRSGKYFMTMEYNRTAEKPTIYVGEGVTLAALKLQNIRSASQIRAQSGRLKGKMQTGKCPHCGGSIRAVTGLATYIICQQCHTSLTLNKEKVQLLQADKARQMQESELTIALGSEARINGISWMVLGAVVMEELGPLKAIEKLKLKISPKNLSEEDENDYDSKWTEYLLYAPDKGFLWLIEQENNRWALATTLDEWPEIDYPSPLIIKGDKDKNLRCLYDYGGRVIYAAGAFYWEVNAEDVNYYRDFGTEKHKLATTLNPNEQSWSVISDVPASAVAAWLQNDKKPTIVPTPMPIATADTIFQEHQNIKAVDFRNKKLLRKWWFEFEFRALKKIQESGFWIKIFNIINMPLFFLIIFTDYFGFMNLVFTIMVCVFAYYVINLNFLKNLKKLLQTKHIFAYYGLIAVIGFSSLNWKHYQNFKETSTSGYSHSTGRWHK